LARADAFPRARRVKVGGVRLSVHAAGPEGGPLVVLLHGWPELAYSWKRQVGPIAALGFRVLAPDGRGFGASDAPKAVEAYGIDHLVADVEGLLDHEKAERAVVVGHDWGGVVAWCFAMLRPGRTAGVAALNTAHLPRSRLPTTEAIRARHGGNHYILRFQEPGVAEGVFGRARDELFSAFFASLTSRQEERAAAADFGSFTSRLKQKGQDAPPCIIPRQDRRKYVKAYRRTGFSPGLNLYRNMDANWRRMEGVDHVIQAPCLMISAERDPILPPAMTRWMDELVPDLEKHIVPEAGHWIQWEASEAVNALLCGWLGRRFAER
jgi:pimeloyl-ACP methyl ester carboxylesterase